MIVVSNCACGQEFDEDLLLDSLYPMERGPDSMWNMCCKSSNGGCGRVVYAKSKQATVDMWNTFMKDETRLMNTCNLIDGNVDESDDTGFLIIMIAITVWGIILGANNAIEFWGSVS